MMRYLTVAVCSILTGLAGMDHARSENDAVVGSFRLEVQGEWVSIDADNVPLKDVIAAMESQINADISFSGIDDRVVTLHHDRIAVDRLLSSLNINYALVYIVDPETHEAVLEGGWGASYKGGQQVRNRLYIPAKMEELVSQAMHPYEEQVTNGLPSVYPVIYPASVNVDGEFNDWPTNMPWHIVGGKTGSYRASPFKTDPADYPAYPPADNVDSAFSWGAVMDDKYLYLAVAVNDDKRIVNQTTDDNLIFLDDSVEFYIDGGNEKSHVYDGNDAQIAIARGDDDDDPNNPRFSPWEGDGHGIPGDQTGTEATVVNTKHGYMVEAKIPLATFGITPRDQEAIGFNLHVNDDDDGGLRDHKLMWSAIEQEEGEQSYHNPSIFGSIIKVDISKPVVPTE